MNGVFITGTDTGIGKTITSALLISALKKYFLNIKYFKPVQTGSDDDTETVAGLTEVKCLPPVYKFKAPISPHRAALLEHKKIELKKIKSSLTASVVKNDFFVVEGAGGLMVPLNDKEITRDLIKLLELPVVIVASTRLGTINHTLLTLECARAKNLSVLGVILVGEEDKGLAETLSRYGDTKILGQIPNLKISSDEIRARGPQFFSKDILELMGCSL